MKNKLEAMREAGTLQGWVCVAFSALALTGFCVAMYFMLASSQVHALTCEGGRCFTETYKAY